VAAFDKLMKTEERNEFVKFDGKEFGELVQNVESI
jgi:hypothetical protein